MFEVRFEDVTKPRHRVVLNELLAGEFSYEARGGPVDSETFELRFHMGEYAVVRDELLDRKHEEMMEQNGTGYQDIHDVLPRTVSVEEGDEITVSLADE